MARKTKGLKSFFMKKKLQRGTVMIFARPPRRNCHNPTLNQTSTQQQQKLRQKMLFFSGPKKVKIKPFFLDHFFGTLLIKNPNFWSYFWTQKSGSWKSVNNSRSKCSLKGGIRLSGMWSMSIFTWKQGIRRGEWSFRAHFLLGDWGGWDSK